MWCARHHLHPGAGVDTSTWWRSWTGRAGGLLAWRLSNTLDTCFCLEALAEALEGCGIPEIFNTDQGSQFTSVAFTGMLESERDTVLDAMAAGAAWTTCSSSGCGAR